MPSVQFTLKDLSGLVGKKLTVDEVEDLVQYAKAEFDEYERETDTVHISAADTAMPYLWSVEGIARLLRGVLGRESGLPKLELKRTKDKIIVDKSVQKVRPFIAAFSASGKRVSEELLKQLIQLQEKLSDTYGRRRRKVSIGIYRRKLAKFPLHYKAVKPKAVSFLPLESDKKMDLATILAEHPTGMKYAHTLDGQKAYPIFLDDKDQVLSFPPIINSADLGRVEPGDDDLLVEVTGTDDEAVDTTCAILAFAFQDRGFQISTTTIVYPDQERVTPFLREDTVKVTPKMAEEVLGITLSEGEFTNLLKKARYGVKKEVITVPAYRSDILHPVDVIEDVAVMYGYDDIPTSPLTTHTVGDMAPKEWLSDRVRQILVGFGMQEVLSAVLTNKELLYDKMEMEDVGTIEIKEYMSSSYSVVRSWLTPILLDVLSKNKHHAYPQMIFEEGIVATRKKDRVVECDRVAVLLCGADTDYTSIRQVLDALLNAFGVDYSVEEAEHSSFIPGRVARVKVSGKGIAYLGEVHPSVLENFEIQMPVAALELNLTDLLALMQK